MLHPVPPVPELRTKVAKRIDAWRRGPGKHPIIVFVIALLGSAFAQSIGWMYMNNVFCMSGFDSSCTGRLDWGVWFLATLFLYVNAWAIASWIADVSERRRLRKLTPVFEQRVAALDPARLQRRHAISVELRERALDREREDARAHFQATLLGWFRNLFIVGSVVPLITVLDIIRRASTLVVFVVIVLAQAWILYKVTKHVRRMRRIAAELRDQWERDLQTLEQDVAIGAPVGAERVTFRPWAGRVRPVSTTARTGP